MKTILVPTDFSDTANKARDYAVQLAQELNAQIFLLNTYHIPYSGASAGTIVNLGKVALEESEKAMNNQAEFLSLNFPNLIFKTFCKPGMLLDSVRRIGKNKEVDLIVMGTTGASGVIGNAIGSTTSALVGEISVPIITVPNESLISYPEKVIVANDLKESGEEILLETLREVIVKEDSEIDFLFIVKENNEAETKINRLKAVKFDETFDTEYHPLQCKENDKVDESILDYIEDKQFDLLVLKSHQRTFWEGLFHKSVSKSLVKHATLPIMVLPD
jgi:nucleotide-binding universal stress UspA family protein